MASKKPKPIKPGVGETWQVRRFLDGDDLVVLVLEVGEAREGHREVRCLTLDAQSRVAAPGGLVTLSNGAFNAPNKRIA